ncbi:MULTISPECIES: hypothetical protein [Roseicyclus]|uniref:Uncharacterized protein n=1 Tax=Roseicyclus marinus TaxID=2161673 RepID=A0AA48KHR1_9RHOB|nr:hypothetical protein MACH21_11190 [Roseicyclus marinus]
MDRMITMILRRAINQILNRGIDAGVRRMTRDRPDATPEQQAQLRQGGQRAKQAFRLLRRFGRF